MEISVVIPVCNEEKNVKELYERLSEVLKGKYEIIFVDDGSKDRTLKVLKSIKDKRVKVIPFQRNFGKAAGLMAGFREATGRIIFTMDGDLQDEPREIPKFMKKLDEGYDMVSGWKYKRHDPVTKTIPSKFFNWLTAKVTGVDIHDSNCGYKAYKRHVVENIRVYGELHRYIPALAHWKGFSVGEVKVKHNPRKAGKSKYGVERLLKGFLDLITVKFITSYLSRPLHFFGFLGFLSGFVGFVLGLYIVYLRIAFGSIQGKNPLLMLVVLLIVIGVQFISLGLLGEMVVSSRDNEEYLIKKENKK